MWSVQVFAHLDDRSRLLIRSRTGLRYPGQVLATEAAGPVLSIITRGMLRGIKRRAEKLVRAQAQG
jgi:hypothetical protein